jgi:hypothetical protein
MPTAVTTVPQSANGMAVLPTVPVRSRRGNKIEPGDERFRGASYSFGHETEFGCDP